MIALAKNTIKPKQEEIDPSVFDLLKGSGYCIYYTRFFGEIIFLPFGGSTSFCTPKYHEELGEIYFESNHGWSIYRGCVNYALFFQQLSSDGERLKNRELNTCDFTDETRFAARHIVLHLTHGNHQYEAHWHQGVDVFFLFCQDCSQQFCVGNVKVKPMADWDQETFLYAAKTAIAAFLDGATTASF